MNNQQLWEKVLGELELSLNKANFNTWLKDTSLSSFNKDSGEAIIGVPTVFAQDWLKKKYHNEIINALKSATNDEIKTVIYQMDVLPKSKSKKAVDLFSDSAASSHIKTTTDQPSTPTIKNTAETQVIPAKYSFENFVVGKNNELAHAAARAVAQSPGKTYNPLFIYGGVGLGKTHLMLAAAAEVTKNHLANKILYTTCEQFTNDYVESIQKNTTEVFRQKYRSADMLLIDDIQFLAGKEGTQEAFFHTFNELHQNNKQVILTSDRPPKAIPNLEARLTSRFECGMIADITQPDLETRMAILEAKCKDKQYILSKDIINFIATNIQNNIRELEGALNCIIAHCQLSRTEPTLDLVKGILGNLNASVKKGGISVGDIIKIVCEFYNLKNEDLLGDCREKQLILPRQIAMYLLREELDYSFPLIGAELGGRDHTTIIYGYKKIKEQVNINEKVTRDINLLKQKLYN